MESRSKKIHKWKAEGSVSSGLLYTFEINSDKKGLYKKHKLEFTGMKATLVLYSIGSGKKYNFYVKKEFTIIEKSQGPLWQSNKDYF